MPIGSLFVPFCGSALLTRLSCFSTDVRREQNESRVTYEPGVLKAVSRKNGQVVLTREVRTAEAPARIILIPDRKTIKADGAGFSSANHSLSSHT